MGHPSLLGIEIALSLSLAEIEIGIILSFVELSLGPGHSCGHIGQLALHGRHGQTLS